MKVGRRSEEGKRGRRRRVPLPARCAIGRRGLYVSRRNLVCTRRRYDLTEGVETVSVSRRAVGDVVVKRRLMSRASAGCNMLSMYRLCKSASHLEASGGGDDAEVGRKDRSYSYRPKLQLQARAKPSGTKATATGPSYSYRPMRIGCNRRRILLSCSRFNCHY